MKKFFIAEINDKQKMSKTPNKYITGLKYTDNNFLFSQEQVGVLV